MVWSWFSQILEDNGGRADKLKVSGWKDKRLNNSVHHSVNNGNKIYICNTFLQAC